MVLLFDRVLLGLFVFPRGSSLAHPPLLLALSQHPPQHWPGWWWRSFELELDSILKIVSQRSLGGWLRWLVANWQQHQRMKVAAKENTDDEANRLWVSIRERSVISRGLLLMLLLGSCFVGLCLSEQHLVVKPAK